jgi:hypothetical protein
MNSHRTSSPLDLMYSMTSRAVLVMYAISFPWLCSRRKLDVPMTTSRPSTPVSAANRASSILQRTSDRRLDTRGHGTMVTHESKSWPGYVLVQHPVSLGRSGNAPSDRAYRWPRSPCVTAPTQRATSLRCSRLRRRRGLPKEWVSMMTETIRKRVCVRHTSGTRRMKEAKLAVPGRGEWYVQRFGFWAPTS